MPLLETRGSASAQGFGLLARSGAATYIEDVFSTWLYTGTGSSQTITNGIDLSTYGGLVWAKSRSSATSNNHWFVDTVRGVNKYLQSQNTDAEGTLTNSIPTFSSTGFSVGSNGPNQNTQTYASWTFRKQPKFFDVVTYTGNGGTLSVSHSLASKPGCIIIKRTDSTGDWLVCTRKSDGNIYAMYLNTTAGQFYDGTEGSLWTSTAVSINWINSNVAAGFNTNGATYVMYLFAHNAGGFGLSGTDNVISCGSFTTNASGQIAGGVTLGYEPQWLLIKMTSAADNWIVADQMRGWDVTGNSNVRELYPNLPNAEAANSGIIPTATGFTTVTNALSPSQTYIYIAIRRGPMRVPTSGTSVFAPSARSGTGASGTSTALGSVTDLTIIKQRGSTQTWAWTDRLRGATKELTSAGTTAETAYANDVTGFDNMTGFAFGSGASGQVNTSASTYIDYLLRRAPGFFDVVCYTGTGANRTVSHNLGAVPELMIVRDRQSGSSNWMVYASSLGAGQSLRVQTTAANVSDTLSWNNTSPTASVFSVGGAGSETNVANVTYVAYLFATVPGVSKVGSYTGTGAAQTINCGFTGGARFILIKRTDSTGDWYVYDSARGIVSGNDPYLLINSTAAEVTTTDYISVQSSGFGLTASAPAALNANGGSFIYLAIA